MRILCFPCYVLLLSFVIGCGEGDPSPRPPLVPGESDSKTTEAKKTTETDQSQMDTPAQEVSAKHVKQKLDEATKAVAAYSENKTEEALAKARKRLDELKQATAALKNNVGQLRQAAQEKLRQSVDQLEGRLQDAQQRLGKLPDAGKKAWEEAADDLEESMDNLKAAYDDAASTLKKAMAESGKDQSKQPASDQE